MLKEIFEDSLLLLIATHCESGGGDKGGIKSVIKECG